MAVTVVKYPRGHVLDTTGVTATVSSSSGALFTKSSHGLSTGDWIYIYSALSAYNGYWYVSVASSSTFRIREYATASDEAFVNSGTVTYYISTAEHGWNAVHLPMVYKLKSDTWPINGVDTSRTITTFTNWNGYTYLVLSGDVKSSGTASTLENVILSGVTGVSGTTITGVYRIIQWFSDTNIVIDLAYNAGHVLSGGTCQYYYLNYHAKVKVYAGLRSGHYWVNQKPFELLSTERVTFDSNGIGELNIADIVKSKIEIFSNNLELDTLPNNIDAWCRVYISVAESYDDSDGYTISEYTGSYTDDTTEVYAVNAKLPFKTRSSGELSEYVAGGTSATVAKFLTPFVEPSIFSGYYFDISYINPSSGAIYMKVDRYLSRVLQSSTIDNITNYVEGVYRYPLSVSSTEDSIDLTLYGVVSLESLSGWSNEGTGQDWTLGATPSYTWGTGPTTKYLAGALVGLLGTDISITINVSFTSSVVTWGFLTSSFTEVGTGGSLVNGSQVVTGTIPAGAEYIFIRATDDPFIGSTVTVLSVSMTPTSVQITETKTIDVVDDCDQFRTTNLYITWLNYLGGYDYWLFTAQKLFSVDIIESKTQEVNIYNNWPKSYGEFADSMTKQSVRKSKNMVKVTSQFLTKDQADALAWIVSSPLVQILSTSNSVTTARTVIVDSSTLKKYQDRDNLYTVSFNITYTDELPAQTS